MTTPIGVAPPVSSVFNVNAGASKDAKKVAEQFEGLFLHKLLEPLQDNEAMFGDGAEARTFSGMFRENLAKAMAKSRPLGIANHIEKALNARANGLAKPEQESKFVGPKLEMLSPLSQGARTAPSIDQKGVYDELIGGI